MIEQASLFGTTPLATFSETFPRWGSMHDGRVFAHPTPERVTEESASSSLHTPTTGDTAPTYDHRSSPGYTRAIPVPNLAAQVDQMLQTPSAADAMGGHLSRGGERSDELLLKGQIKSLLPTPTADHSRGLVQPGTDYQSLPNAIDSLGDHTKPPSEGGNE